MSAPFVTSPILSGIRHGFFGREGGVSTGDFASLNMSEKTDDGVNQIASNRAQAMAALGISTISPLIVRQTHSTIALTLNAPLSGPSPEADAIVTATPGLVLGILTADCTPILFADPEAGVIAAAHAGWKGALGGIIGNTVAAMVALGATPKNIAAAIGPTISGPNYEVGPEFVENLLAQHPGAAKRISIPAGGRAHFDLPSFVADQLAASGVDQIDDLQLCTYALPGRYFSHRRSTHEGRNAGRQIALISLS